MIINLRTVRKSLSIKNYSYSTHNQLAKRIAKQINSIIEIESSYMKYKQYYIILLAFFIHLRLDIRIA